MIKLTQQDDTVVFVNENQIVYLEDQEGVVKVVTVVTANQRSFYVKESLETILEAFRK